MDVIGGEGGTGSAAVFKALNPRDAEGANLLCEHAVSPAEIVWKSFRRVDLEDFSFPSMRNIVHW